MDASRSLKGKRAIITGASRGIGRAIAVMLAQQGVRCALIARNVEKLQETAAACEAQGTPAKVVACDLLDTQRCKSAIEDIARAVDGIDLLINNAGLYSVGPFYEGDADTYDRLLDTNVKGIFHTCRAALPYLARSKQAAIINIASMAGVRAIASEAVYAASKHAVVGFTQALFQEARASGIKVSAICPGLVATQMAENRGAELEKAIRPEDVAEAVRYVLLSGARVCPTQICLEPQRDPMS